ncbi:MAG: FecR domain-containing protein [Phenylobacterium sp.]|uniref:FecR family protein n=1 Tax=Phenylobacterium sp. TaxID=1871053 RepID=UPI0017B331AF|nr:FecR domain-containing protein [Phenylobacterium sp.]MBA4794895.1 FecR domain-containing protein [Phenylobacterium sp.]
MLQRLSALLADRPQTAEAWLARMGRPDVRAADRTAFQAWLESDPDHLRQYEDAKAFQAELASLRGEFALDLARLRRREPRPARASRRLILAGGLAAAGLAAVVALPPMLAPAPEARLYESAPGQILDVTLEDGTRVTLDAGSAVSAAIGGDVRRVRLERGGAYFDVAHDADHPFQVSVADRQVIVTGTRFVTALTGDAAEISVLQGRVAVGRRDAAEPRALDGALPVAPGERAVFRAGEPVIRKAQADVETATAWRRRRLVFQDAPLSQVIVAAARYSDHPLVPADPALDQVRVTVVLPLEGEGALADRMAALLPIETARAPDGRILVRAQ